MIFYYGLFSQCQSMTTTAGFTILSATTRFAYDDAPGKQYNFIVLRVPYLSSAILLNYSAALFFLLLLLLETRRLSIALASIRGGGAGKSLSPLTQLFRAKCTRCVRKNNERFHIFNQLFLFVRPHRCFRLRNGPRVEIKDKFFFYLICSYVFLVFRC